MWPPIWPPTAPIAASFLVNWQRRHTKNMFKAAALLLLGALLVAAPAHARSLAQASAALEILRSECLVARLSRGIVTWAAPCLPPLRRKASPLGW